MKRYTRHDTIKITTGQLYMVKLMSASGCYKTIIQKITGLSEYIVNRAIGGEYDFLEPKQKCKRRQ